MLRTALLLLISGSLFAQVPANLPASWVGAGASYSTAAGGWVTVATLINRPAMLYSITTEDLAPARIGGKRAIQTAVRTGLATVLRSIGPITILAVADAGTATAGTNVGGAFSGGGAAILAIGKTNWMLVFWARQTKSSLAGTDAFYKFAVGRKF